MKVVSNFKNILFIAISLYVWSLSCDAQFVVPLNENTTIKKYITENQVPRKSTLQSAAISDTLKLPFFDDFSRITVFPDPKKWKDRYAFINATFPVEPISYGVATLDAMDDKGNIYNVGDKPQSCDSLTSLPIDLSEFSGTQKKIYLSFFYQPQGNGEAPETKDSLVVELYSPKDTMWFWAWSITGSTLKPFKSKIIQINNNLFQKGFQFRFRNYVSMSDNDTQFGLGALGNFDLWHIDYVRLNSDSILEHQTVNDFSLLYPLKSSYSDYQAIPWDHVDSANFNYRRIYMPITIRTPITTWSLDTTQAKDTITIPVGRGYFMRNVKTGAYIITPFTQGEAERLLNDTVYLREDAFLPIISYDGSDEGIIETGAFLVNTPENIHINDTVKKIEYFKYHYAYDDGTAERGFGNPGPVGGVGSYIAVYFQLYRTDYLRAIDILFNKTRNNYNGSESFQVCVWRSSNVLPGELIYDSKEFYKPDTTLGFGQFMRIILDSAIFIKDEIFIGLRQNTDEFLNIGYDVNDPHKDKIFYNNFGSWENFATTNNEEGSLMIRPVMSRNPIALGIPVKKTPSQISMTVSPNPANDFIYFKLDDDFSRISSVSVYDMLGNKKFVESNDAHKVNVSVLAPGIYILKVTCEDGKNFSGKFVKSR